MRSLRSSTSTRLESGSSMMMTLRGVLEQDLILVVLLALP